MDVVVPNIITNREIQKREREERGSKVKRERIARVWQIGVAEKPSSRWKENEEGNATERQSPIEVVLWRNPAEARERRRQG